MAQNGSGGGMELELVEYAPTMEHDINLLQWWSHLLASGDLAAVFSPSAHTLSRFYETFQPPTALVYGADNHGIVVAVWFKPFLNAATLGLWIREDYRHRQWWLTVGEALRRAFRVVPLLLFTTKSPAASAAARDSGFTMLGTIPYLLDGEAAEVGFLTRERFCIEFERATGRAPYDNEVSAHV